MSETKNTTKKDCSLQKSNDIQVTNNEVMSNENVVDSFDEKEFDEKTRMFLKHNTGDFSAEQLNFIITTWNKIKKDIPSENFVYRGYSCGIELDSLGKWRIFVRIKKSDDLPYYHYERYSDYDNSARFTLNGFPLGLWYYGDYIGLDDFFGVHFFSHISWSSFFNNEEDDAYTQMKWKSKGLPKLKIIKKESAKKLCIYLVDCLILYNNSLQKRIVDERVKINDKLIILTKLQSQIEMMSIIQLERVNSALNIICGVIE